MSEVEEGPPVCFGCEFEQRQFPCRGGGGFSMDKVAHALRETYRLSRDADRKKRARERKASDWAPECVHELILESPQMALDFILLALPLFETREEIAALAAGPLENLLDYHSEKVIDRIEAEAADNPRFRLLLAAVWGTNSVKPEIRRRLQTAGRLGSRLPNDHRESPQSDD